MHEGWEWSHFILNESLEKTERSEPTDDPVLDQSLGRAKIIILESSHTDRRHPTRTHHATSTFSTSTHAGVHFIESIRK